MAENEWKINKGGATCSCCRKAFDAEQRYYSALIQGAESLDRTDFCESCFQDKRPDNVFYFWRTVQAGPDSDDAKRQKPRLDVDYIVDFFKRLEGDDNPQRVAFRYILALMLSRKKLLVLEGKKQNAAGQDVHLFREKRGGQSHPVVEPSLSEEEIGTVSEELGVLLGLSPPPARKAETVAAAESATDTSGAPEEKVELEVTAAPAESGQAQIDSETSRRPAE